MNHELNGDFRLSLLHRLIYIFRNFYLNFFFFSFDASLQRYRVQPYVLSDSQSSPSRLLTEVFLRHELPIYLPIDNLHVLDIGCGSGFISQLLSDAGYYGTYLGVDISDKFSDQNSSNFDCEFINSDIHLLERKTNFYNLIISVSALEHIAEDYLLINSLSSSLAREGIQIHFVPSSWGLFTYLWHGWRQYSTYRISQTFPPQSTFIALGGFLTFILHIMFITVPEIIFRLNLRNRFPYTYSKLLRLCCMYDKYFPFCSTMIVVISKR